MRCKLHFLHSMSLVALHHINEIRTRPGDVMSYKSLLTGREKIITRGSLCNETTRFTLISVATESSWNWGGGRVGVEKGRGSSYIT